MNNKQAEVLLQRYLALEHTDRAAVFCEIYGLMWSDATHELTSDHKRRGANDFLKLVDERVSEIEATSKEA